MTPVPKNTEADGKKTNSGVNAEKQSPTSDSKAVSTVKTDTPKKTEKPLINIDAPFNELTKSYYELNADERTQTYDQFLYKHKVSWKGTVVDTSSNSITVYGGSDSYTDNDKSLPFVFIAKLTDKSELDKIKNGDKVTISGEVGSRGNVDPAANWKLYEAAISKHEAGESKELTLATFKKIKNGMSKKEVFKLIGEGELLSSAGDEGTEFYTEMYSYSAEGSSLGANATFTFQGGKLMAKAQIGLK